ncbi:MAG: DUF4349 domain-containing protein [Chloroflexota bacterium]|nr:DUF4349 domain-containing protein [Chloroflexota bacterium]
MLGQIRTTPRGRWLVFMTLIALLTAACASSASAPNDRGAAGPGTGTTSGNGQSSGEQPAGGVPAAPPAAAVAPSNLLIVKTGTLGLQVKAIDAGLADADAKISALGGYVSGSQRAGDGANAVANVTYRIPAARWDEALVALRGLAVKVLGEQTRTDEVTGQVRDLGARITNLQATERALQAIMDKAVKISDVLEVQAQLTNVRGQIEQLATEKQHLQDQSAYGTLAVTFGTETVAVEQARKGFDPAAEADRATASLVEVGQALAAAAIWFGILWLPILFGLGLIGLVGFVIVRRIRRSRPGMPGAGGTGTPGPILPAAGA